MDWLNLAHGVGHWRALVNTAMKKMGFVEYWEFLE
jgi:hypothetical protein